jgi:hypothetical protein
MASPALKPDVGLAVVLEASQGVEKQQGLVRRPPATQANWRMPLNLASNAFPPRDHGFSHRDDAGAEPRYLAAPGRSHLNRSTDAAAGLFLQAPQGAPNGE